MYNPEAFDKMYSMSRFLVMRCLGRYTLAYGASPALMLCVIHAHLFWPSKLLVSSQMACCCDEVVHQVTAPLAFRRSMPSHQVSRLWLPKMHIRSCLMTIGYKCFLLMRSTKKTSPVCRYNLYVNGGTGFQEIQVGMYGIRRCALDQFEYKKLQMCASFMHLKRLRLIHALVQLTNCLP